MSSFQIRRAEEHRDWRALRLLLPDAIHHGCGCDALVATDDAQSRRVIAAAALTPHMRLAPAPGPRFALHVIEPWRRRGVAAALRNATSSIAQAQGADALYAWNRVSPESREATAWRALGFDRTINCPLNQIDAAHTVDLLQRIFDRLKARGAIPAEAQIIGSRDADADQIVELVATHLAGAASGETLRIRLLGRHPTPFDPVLSRILLLGNRVVGAILGRPAKNRLAWAEVNVVHPALRGRWANVWLKLDATRRARDLGFQTFVFETYPQHADTAKLTTRLQGVTIPRVELYHVIAPHH